MAEVYIKDFKMPETCAKCPLKSTLISKKMSWCNITGHSIKILEQTERAKFCPLREKW